MEAVKCIFTLTKFCYTDFMKLILLYGPPAVGKLTIAKVLSQVTGISVFHNHMILNPLREIFGLESPIRAKLEYEFRLRIVEEAITADKDLIMTGVITMKNYRAFYEKVIEMVEKKDGGEVYLIHLTAPEKVLKTRVVTEDRKIVNKLHSLEEWEAFAKEYPEMFGVFSQKEHLSIDTSHMLPQEAAQKIITHYQLA